MKSEISYIKVEKLSEVETHTINYGHIIDPETNETVEEVMVSVLRAPKTFTREDIIEINCHGGILTINRILELTMTYGARMAEPVNIQNVHFKWSYRFISSRSGYGFYTFQN